MNDLTPELGERFAELALRCVQREYPNKLDHVLRSERDLLSPRHLHPAFFGCYDWHSCVHSHWTLAHLLERFKLRAEGEIVRVLDRNLSAANLEAEARYFSDLGHASFERPYGWAWLLRLAMELRQAKKPWAAGWAKNLEPLETAVAARFREFFPKQDYPIRAGVHSNSAFALGLALDYSRVVGNFALGDLVEERARRYFLGDEPYPAWLEPCGNDFLSSALCEADLLSRVLGQEEFAAWFDQFLTAPGRILEPPSVSDRGDPQIGHLDGLCLSKAWCLRRIGRSLPEGHRLRPELEKSAEAHERAGLAHVVSGNYLGEHWLASFAVYMFATV